MSLGNVLLSSNRNKEQMSTPRIYLDDVHKWACLWKWGQMCGWQPGGKRRAGICGISLWNEIMFYVTLVRYGTAGKTKPLKCIFSILKTCKLYVSFKGIGRFIFQSIALGL